MSTQRDHILEQALALPPADRIVIADALEESLNAGIFATPEIAAAWSAEVERRVEAYDRGATTADDVDVAMENIRKQLAVRQASRAQT